MKNCMFQYATKHQILVNTGLITEFEADELFNKNKQDFKNRVDSNEDPEMAIWINCKDDSHYRETCIHWYGSEMSVIDGDLYLLTKV